MRFVSTLSEKFSALLDSHIDRAVTRVILRNKTLITEPLYTVLVNDVSEKVAETVDVDTSEIARNVVRNLDMDDVVSGVVGEIDMAQVCEQCAERIEVDEEEVIRRAAESVADNTDSDDVARQVAEHLDMDTSEVAEKVAENIDIDTDEIIEKAVEQIVGEIDNDSITEQVAERLAENEELDYDQLARAILRTVAKTAML